MIDVGLHYYTVVELLKKQGLSDQAIERLDRELDHRHTYLASWSGNNVRCDDDTVLTYEGGVWRS